MTNPTRKSASDYANSKLRIAGLDRLVPDLDPFGNLQEALINEIKTYVGRDIGAVCQLISILQARSGMKLRDTAAAIKKLIESTLSYEHHSTDAVEAIAKADYPELAKYKSSGLSYRYILKNVDVTTLTAMAASLSGGMSSVCALMSQMEHSTWVKFGDEWGFDEDEYVKEALPLVLEKLETSIGKGATLEHGCSLYSGGPYPKGFTAPTQAMPMSSTTPSNHPNTGSFFTPTSTTTGASTMATATTSTTPLSNLNAAFKPVIDNIFSQSGLTVTVDSLISALLDREKANNDVLELKEIGVKQTDHIEELERKLANASAATSTPTTIDIVAHSSTIPSGTMNLVEASTLFPLMAGIALKVPSFSWVHAHPDVPAINTGYIFRKEMLMKVLRCLSRGENIWLSGHTGSGKTTFVEQIAARLGWPVARVAFDSNVDRSELVGRMSLAGDGKGGTTSSWLPGILETAITNGYILLCDEMDAGHPNALYTLQPLLEGKSLTLLEDGGRIVPASPMFRIAATGNTTGNGDPSSLYPACRILSAATLDRFQTFLNVPYMTHDEEVALISNSVPGLTKKMVVMLAKFAGELRNAFVTNQTPVSYSPRRSVAFAREVDDMFSMGFKDEQQVLATTFKSKLYDAASEEFRQRLTEIANASLGCIDPTKGMD